MGYQRKGRLRVRCRTTGKVVSIVDPEVEKERQRKAAEAEKLRKRKAAEADKERQRIFAEGEALTQSVPALRMLRDEYRKSQTIDSNS